MTRLMLAASDGCIVGKACNRDLSWQGWTCITHSNCTADLTADAQQQLRMRHAEPSLTDSLRKIV